MREPRSEVDIRALIDRQPLSGIQIRVIALCSLVALLDGVDTQSIGVAAPLIAKALEIPIAGFGPVFSAALVGAAIGALSFGPLADRFGYKRFLILAAFTFGCFTFLTARCNSIETLIACRFAAGLGMGGALPCFVALSSEFAPKRMRAALVTLSWAAFPLGGMIGGFLNAMVIERFGWQAIFYIGGTLPIVVAIVLALALPESLRLLLERPDGQRQVARFLARMYDFKPAAGTRFVDLEPELRGMPVKHLFTDGRALGTVLLWVPFFMAFGNLTVVVLWTPSLLRQSGISPADTAFVIAFNGLGASIGMAAAGRMMESFGAVRTLVPAFLLGVLATAGLGYSAHSVPFAATFTGLVGLFVGFGAAGCVALAALVYPSAIRSTGVGWGMGMGRIGQALSPLLAGALLGWHWSMSEIMLVVACAPFVAAVFIVLVRLQAGSDAVALARTPS